MPGKFSPKREHGFAPVIVLVLIAVGALGLIASSNITTTTKPSTPPSQVLGEDETIQKEAEQQKESSETHTVTSTTANIQVKTQSEGSKQETEIETSDGHKIKTKVEDDGKTKIEIERGKIKIKKEHEASRDAELEDDEDEQENEQEEAENELENEGIKLSTESGRRVISKNNIHAETTFPLSINATTRQLTVTTPNGTKVVTILPDQAIKALLAANIINKIEGQSDSASPSAQLGNINGKVELEMKDQEMVYKVNGEKEYKILRFIPVFMPITAYVSAQSGSVTAQEQSLLVDLLKLLSF